MTPSDLLVAAADRVRDLAAAAPNDGPWTAERMFWKLGSKYMPDKWWFDVRDEAGTVALIPEEAEMADDAEDAKGRAGWIAALSPAVSQPLEAILRDAARKVEIAAAVNGRGEQADRYTESKFANVLALARALCPDLAEEKTP